MAKISRRELAALAVLPFMSSGLRAQDAVPAANVPGGHLTIPVEINGMGPFHFVVDTGADISVLADTTARALKLPPAGAVMLAQLPSKNHFLSDVAAGAAIGLASAAIARLLIPRIDEVRRELARPRSTQP